SNVKNGAFCWLFSNTISRGLFVHLTEMARLDSALKGKVFAQGTGRQLKLDKRPAARPQLSRELTNQIPQRSALCDCLGGVEAGGLRNPPRTNTARKTPDGSQTSAGKPPAQSQLKKSGPTCWPGQRRGSF